MATLEKHPVAKVGDIELGTCKITKVSGRSIGIYFNGEEYFAIRNVCPHEQIEICKGRFTGTTLESKPHEYIYGRESEILVCPWHGWEFDVRTGKSLVDPERYWVNVYEVSIEEDTIFVHM